MPTVTKDYLDTKKHQLLIKETRQLEHRLNDLELELIDALFSIGLLTS